MLSCFNFGLVNICLLWKFHFFSLCVGSGQYFLNPVLYNYIAGSGPLFCVSGPFFVYPIKNVLRKLKLKKLKLDGPLFAGSGPLFCRIRSFILPDPVLYFAVSGPFYLAGSGPCRNYNMERPRGFNCVKTGGRRTCT